MNRLAGKESIYLGHKEIEDTEWESIVDDLRRAERWTRMWELIFLAPVKWSAEMVHAMRAAKWQARAADK